MKIESKIYGFHGKNVNFNLEQKIFTMKIESKISDFHGN